MEHRWCDSDDLLQDYCDFVRSKAMRDVFYNQEHIVYMAKAAILSSKTMPLIRFMRLYAVCFSLLYNIIKERQGRKVFQYG